MMFPMFSVNYETIEDEEVGKGTIVEMRRADSYEETLERVIESREKDSHSTRKTTREAEALEDARKRIADAYFSLEQFTGNAEETEEYRRREVRNTIAQVKKDLRELRDTATDESVRKVYDNFYRTAHLQVGNKAKKQRTVTIEYEEPTAYGCSTTNLKAGIIPLIVAAAGAGVGRRRGERKKRGEKKVIKERNDTELLLRFIIGTASEQKYTIESINDLLRRTCSGDFFSDDMQRLNNDEVNYIRKEVLSNLPEYVNRSNSTITAPEEGDPTKGPEERRRNVIDRGLKRLEQLLNPKEQLIMKRAYSIFAAYEHYEPPTKPGEPSNPKGVNPVKDRKHDEPTDIAHLLEDESHEDATGIEMKTGRMEVSDPQVAKTRGNVGRAYTKTGEKGITHGTIDGPLYGTEAGPLATPSNPEAPAQINEEKYNPTIQLKKTYAPRGVIKTLGKIGVAAGALVAGIMLAIGISNYIQRERAPGEENVSSYSVSTPEEKIETQEAAPEQKPQARIQYKPQTAPAYDSTNPAPWYQIEKAQLSADGSSLELKLGGDLIAEGNTIRARYQTPEGKIKTLYANPQGEQTLHVNGTILDVGVGMKKLETKGFTYYSSISFQ